MTYIHGVSKNNIDTTWEEVTAYSMDGWVSHCVEDIIRQWLTIRIHRGRILVFIHLPYFLMANCLKYTKKVIICVKSCEYTY